MEQIKALQTDRSELQMNQEYQQLYEKYQHLKKKFVMAVREKD